MDLLLFQTPVVGPNESGYWSALPIDLLTKSYRVGGVRAAMMGCVNGVGPKPIRMTAQHGLRQPASAPHHAIMSAYHARVRVESAIHWTDKATALGTVGLFAVAVMAGTIAYFQYRAFVRSGRVRAANKLAAKWNRGKTSRWLGAIDELDNVSGNRLRNLRLYHFLHAPVVRKVSESTELYNKRVRKRKRASFDAHDIVESLASLASETWAAVAGGLVDKKVLFQQIAYNACSSYWELELVLAYRASFKNMLYDDYTKLAKAAQRFYRKGPFRELLDDLVAYEFKPLPADEEEYIIFRHQAARQKMVFEAAYFLCKYNLLVKMATSEESR